LRHLKLEAKRRLAAGGFATLHDAQTAIALLPAALAREALTPQAEPGPAGIRVGLGWLLDGPTAAHGGAGFEAVTLLRSRVRDRRSYVVLTSRAVSVGSLDDGLRRAWLKGGLA